MRVHAYIFTANPPSPIRLQCKHRTLKRTEEAEEANPKPHYAEDVLEGNGDSTKWWWQLTAEPTDTPHVEAEIHDVKLNHVEMTDVHDRTLDRPLNRIPDEALDGHFQDLRTLKPDIVSANPHLEPYPHNSHLRHNLQQSSGKLPIPRRTYQKGKHAYSNVRSESTRDRIYENESIKKHMSDREKIKVIEDMVNEQEHLSSRDKQLLIQTLVNSEFSNSDIAEVTNNKNNKRNTVRRDQYNYDRNSIKSETSKYIREHSQPSTIKVPFEKLPGPLLDSLWKATLSSKTISSKTVKAINPSPLTPTLHKTSFISSVSSSSNSSALVQVHSNTTKTGKQEAIRFSYLFGRVRYLFVS